MGSQRIPGRRASHDGAADRRTILDAIRHIVRDLRLTARAAEQHVGLSGAQLFVLHRLAETGVVSLGELARETLTDPSSVSVLVSRLHGRGLVSRVRAGSDARRVEIAITPEGRKLVSRAPAVAQERLIAALDGLEPSQRRTLARLLLQTVRAMGLANEPAEFFFEEGGPRKRKSNGAGDVGKRRTR